MTKTSLFDRWFAKVRLGDDCWIWIPPKNPDGYGMIMDKNQKTKLAHRVGYELLVGPIPEGHVLNHACHDWDLKCPGGKQCPHRACVKPTHLEPCLHIENNNSPGSKSFSALNAKKTECPKGHVYDEAGVYVYKETRYCLKCKVDARRGWYQRQKVESMEHDQEDE
jgi:hypothetical protein